MEASSSLEETGSRPESIHPGGQDVTAAREAIQDAADIIICWGIDISGHLHTNNATLIYGNVEANGCS